MRKRYWQLTAAALLAMSGSVCAQPSCGSAPITRERPDDFVALSRVAPEIVRDMRYAGSQNFTGRVVAGYLANECWLTRPAALALQQAARHLHQAGWRLKVYDCYRPQRAVNDFMHWAQTASHATKARYYPQVVKSELVPQGYIARCSGHSRGSTVDVGPLPLRTSAPRLSQAACGVLDPAAAATGTGFDCFDPRSHTHSKAIKAQARRLRTTLEQAMQAAGFRNYPREWWHYALVNEPYPRRYFDFPVTQP